MSLTGLSTGAEPGADSATWNAEVLSVDEAAGTCQVVIPLADNSRHEHGPCPYMPSAGKNPEPGDQCLVVFDDDGLPWVPAFRGPAMPVLAPGEVPIWNGSGWEAFNPASQAEMDAVTADDWVTQARIADGAVHDRHRNIDNRFLGQFAASGTSSLAQSATSVFGPNVTIESEAITLTSGAFNIPETGIYAGWFELFMSPGLAAGYAYYYWERALAATPSTWAELLGSYAISVYGGSTYSGGVAVMGPRLLQAGDKVRTLVGNGANGAIGIDYRTSWHLVCLGGS